MSLHANNLSSAINWNFQTTDIGQLFKLPSAIGKSVPVFENDLLVQKITPNYHFDVDMVRSILAFLFAENHGDGLMFYGPHGCGKTSLIREVLGRLHWPTLMLSWNETSDTADLIGRVGISFGNTEFEYGPLALAAKNGYALVINEIDRGRAGNLVALNDILDGGKLLIKETGEVITPHKNFRLICTANSAGSGDLTGAYTGSVRKLDPAFLDRFAMLEVSYMDHQTETDLMLLQFPDFQAASAEFVSRMCAFAAETRAKCHDVAEALNSPLSTRALTRFFRYGLSFGLHRKIDHGTPCEETVMNALNLAYLSRLSPEEREVATNILKLNIGF
ncbi:MULTISPECIES: AAA family ATPase [Falsigemmobacter]|uniref:AAA family ATPase n=2 Tax=Falsigemmobacter TaxID=2780027 RepID=A0A451GGK5_9RHOB|nr:MULTISPECIES: AAA family ATPase [Falsigemmobacter]RWY36199.1 AAA family ATPase [Falsigemmobacter intermedius]